LGAILISGTPGTGKTTLGRSLAQRINYEFIDIGEVAKREHIYVSDDPVRDTKIINEPKLAKRIEKEIIAVGGKAVASSHYAEIISPKLVEKVIVLRTHPDELKRRLVLRGWKTEKMEENLEAEILGVCSSNALRKYGRERVHEIDTTKIPADETLRVAVQIIESNSQAYIIGSINWLEELERANRLDSYILDK
jgi:adenylate kinase